MSTIIKAQNIQKTYAKQRVLKGIDFEIEKGQIVGLIGPNGAGKTTLIKCILGLLPCEGELDVLGINPKTNRPKLMQDVSFIADVAILPRWLKVAEAIEFMENVHPNFNRQKAISFLDKTDISMHQKVKELSKGMIVQLHLALIIAIEAKILVLDEPTLGLDIIYRKSFYDTLLNDYFNENRTIIITTHQVEEVEHLFTHIMMINKGALILNDSMENVATRFVEVLADSKHHDKLIALSPVATRKAIGKDIFLFENVDPKKLKKFGEIRLPSISDLFVAKISPNVK